MNRFGSMTSSSDDVSEINELFEKDYDHSIDSDDEVELSQFIKDTKSIDAIVFKNSIQMSNVEAHLSIFSQRTSNIVDHFKNSIKESE